MTLQAILIAPTILIFISIFRFYIRRISVKFCALCRKNETTLNRGRNRNGITDRVRLDFPTFFQPLPSIDRIHKKKTHQSSQDSSSPAVLQEVSLLGTSDSSNRNQTSVSPTTTCCRIQRVTSDKPILVLDLDETLVHAVLERSQITKNPDSFVELTIHECETKIWVSVRPGCAEFLEASSTDYELMLWTAGTQPYAETVLAYIDPTGLLQHRRFRQHCTFVNSDFGGGYYVKDLSKLECDLNQVTIVDNNHLSFELHPKNGIRVEDYIGSADDTVLSELQDTLRRSRSPSSGTHSNLNGVTDSRSDILLICDAEVSLVTDLVLVENTYAPADHKEVEATNDSSCKKRKRAPKRHMVPTRRSERQARKYPRRSARLLARQSKVGSN